MEAGVIPLQVETLGVRPMRSRSRPRFKRSLSVRAMEVGRSVGRGSRRGGKAGVRIRDPNQRFWIRPAMEAFVDEQPSLGVVSTWASPDLYVCRRSEGDRGRLRGSGSEGDETLVFVVDLIVVN
jgi:hypothetical protein